MLEGHHPQDSHSARQKILCYGTQRLSQKPITGLYLESVQFGSPSDDLIVVSFHAIPQPSLNSKYSNKIISYRLTVFGTYGMP